MTKKRVYELAKELGVDNKELISRLEKFGIAVRSHSSTLEDSDIQKIQQELQSGEAREMVEQRIKSTVIRRRVIRPPVEEVKPEVVVHETVPAKPEKPKEDAPLKEAPKAKVIDQEPAPPKIVTAEKTLIPIALPEEPVVEKKELPAEEPPKKIAEVTPTAPKEPEEKIKTIEIEKEPSPSVLPPQVTVKAEGVIERKEKEVALSPQFLDLPRRLGDGGYELW